MQRLFSMFPAGSPGIALLLLRASVAIALAAQSYSHRQDLSAWIQATAIVIAVAITAGFFTPIVAAMSLAFHALVWFGFGLGGAPDVIVLSVDAVALALLGPGAYSVDSYRFGRRVVVLPPSP